MVRSGARSAKSTTARSRLLGFLLGVILFGQDALGAQLKSVQSGTVKILAGSLSISATLSPPVDMNKAFLVFGLTEFTDQPNDGQVSGQITNPTTVTFQRNAGSNGDRDVKWYVAEFVSGVSVQRGTTLLPISSPADIDVLLGQAVTLGKSFPLISFRTDGGGDFDRDDFVRAKITAPSNLRLIAPSAGPNAFVEWQVVEYTDANVQTGDVSFLAPDPARTATLASFNPAKSWLIYNYNCASSGGTDIGQKLVRGVITNGTTLTFDRYNTGQDINLTWHLVEFTDDTLVQHASQAFALGEALKDVPLSNAPLGVSIAAAGAYMRSGRSNFSGNDWAGDGWFRLDLTSSTNLRITRGSSSGAADVGWFVIQFSQCLPALSTTEPPGPPTEFTITGPGSFEMTFSTLSGGTVRSFFDLAEDSGRFNDLAGGASRTEGLYTDGILIGPNWHRTDANDGDSKLTVLEATSTRVRLLQEAHYQREDLSMVFGGGTTKGFGEYSIYPSGRMALRWTRTTMDTTPAHTQREMGIAVHLTGSSPLDTWAAYAQNDSPPFPQLPGDQDFMLVRNDVPGARTDFLNILYQDWRGYFADADQVNWVANPGGGLDWGKALWEELNPPAPPQLKSETWNFLTYFKPTDLGDTPSPWLDPDVTGRSADYRNPDDLGPLPLVAGDGWFDPNENTSGPNDFFNESEGAYTLNFDPSGPTGLSFEIDGGSIPRFHPFFKIRQWRSLQKPISVTLAGNPLKNNLDFRADVKPLSRAHFAQDLLWYSTLEDSPAVTAPDVGSVGTHVGSSFLAARYGRGFEVPPAVAAYFSFPKTDFNPAKGALEFWYKPTYDKNEATTYDLAGFVFDGLNEWLLQKKSDGNLDFTIKANGTVSQLIVDGTQFGWVANEWVHLRLEWDDTAPLGTQQRVFLQGREPPHTDPTADYNSLNLTVPLQFNVGTQTGTSNFSPGIYDELHVYGGSPTAPTRVGYGGLTGPSEFLADGTNNFQLVFDPVDGQGRGEYLYLSSDSKFRGLNVRLETNGSGTGPDLQWEYWNGFLGSWIDLDTCCGFVDQTNELTRSGTIYWTSDPAGWSRYSVNGGPDLYYVRAYLSAGSYSIHPREKVIKTDILLFQYCGDITLNLQRFTFAPPTPTAVELLSLEAYGRDGSVEISWETAAEVENLGFHLSRSSSERGPFERITATLIPGLGSSPLGARYRYLDSGLRNGEPYFYILEDVETSGARTPHGPVSATPEAGASPPAPPDVPVADSRAGIVYGKPEETSLRVLASDRSGLTLELLTGGFYAEPQDDGSVRLSVPGFAEEHSAIPVKRVSVEAVVGRKVRIVSVEARELAVFSSLRPTDAAIPEMIVTRGVVRPGSSRGRAIGRHSEEWARLVSVGFQGEVKKALLELAPLRWDGMELSLARRLTVRVVFAGRELLEESLGGSRGRRHRETRNHGSGRVVARLSTRQSGLYRVRFEDVLGLRGRAVPQSRLRLSYQGKPVAYHLERVRPGGVEGADRRFGPGTVLYFVSKGASLNPYGEAAVYELAVGEAGLTMPVENATVSGPPTKWHWQRLEREEDRIYHPALLLAEEPWFWDTLLSPVTKSYPFEISGLASVGETARLEVRLQGATDFAGSPDHHLRVYVNGSLVSEGFGDGKNPLKLRAEIGPGVLLEGENQISIENVGGTQSGSSMVMLERFAVAYPRQAAAERGVLDGLWVETGVAEVTGLSGRAFLLDVTGEPPRWLTGIESAQSGLRFAVQAGHRYLAVREEATLKAELSGPLASRLKSERNVAEYLVVGPAELLLEAGPLLELRRSQGLQTKAVPIQEVYSEFGYGEERPEAIRDFLAYAYHHWAKPSPRYVLLLGDATYDFKDYLKTGVRNGVPPWMLKTSFWFTASDPSYVSVNGEDELPDLAIGRLPARTTEEARALVQKIVAYETGGGSLGGRAVLVVDNPDAGGDFERDGEEIAATLLSGRPVETISIRKLGRDGTRRAIGEAFDRGASLLSYLGHGAILVWASENVFNNLDVKSLSPQDQQPFLLTMNCLNGYFHFPYLNSLAEELVKAERRGAIAAFSPSGLSLNDPAHRYHKALLSELVSGKHERLGDAVLGAQAAFADGGEFLELISIYHLLGDPALRVR